LFFFTCEPALVDVANSFFPYFLFASQKAAELSSSTEDVS